MEFFNRSRSYVAAQGVGVAQGALEMAIKHVTQKNKTPSFVIRQSSFPNSYGNTLSRASRQSFVRMGPRKRPGTR
jgi:alkylation response protein AidB-like acyl-CoA dehydrogenase